MWQRTYYISYFTFWPSIERCECDILKYHSICRLVKPTSTITSSKHPRGRDPFEFSTDMHIKCSNNLQLKAEEEYVQNTCHTPPKNLSQVKSLNGLMADVNCCMHSTARFHFT